jgi:anti-sigma factor RsiW
MNHAYIDDNAVVEAYLRHRLSLDDIPRFEAHLVDCEECRDRLLLAEMFHARNGKPAVLQPAPEPEPLPNRAKLVANLEPWQIWAILIAAALLLVLIPAAGIFFFM